MESVPYTRYADTSDGTCRVAYGFKPVVAAMDCPKASTTYLDGYTVSRRTTDEFNPEATILRINKQTSYLASQQTSILKTKTILGPPSNKPNLPRWNNQSDRILPSVQRTRMSNPRTAGSPGAMSPGGAGVDVKHGSYDRYLAKKKYKNSLNKNNECIVKKCN
jgi:hypothetical protein